MKKLRKPWRLAWRTPIMPASAFWYFATEHEADTAASQLQTAATWTVSRERTPQHPNHEMDLEGRGLDNQLDECFEDDQ